MFLLGFFVLPMVLVTGRELSINNYIVKINENILENVEPTGNSSDELDLSGLGLENIDENAFRNATNLTKLNLSNNSLTIFPSERLKFLGNLKNLSVANNRIRRMPSDSVGLDNLEVLDLSYNPVRSLDGLGSYGRGRCDFRVKGAPIMTISHTYFMNRQAVTNPKPLAPVVMSFYSICNGGRPSFFLQDATNENATLSDKKIKCPKLNEPLAIPFSTSEVLDKNSQVEICIENGILQRLSILPSKSSVSDKNCKKIVNLDGEPRLNLAKMGIENFARGWYRPGPIFYRSIDFSSNKIAKLTRNLLNDLPESVKHVRLSGNDIKIIEAGIIDNKFLMYLDLSDNKIHDIQFNAFENSNLNGLILSRNNFTDTKFVKKLPSNLTELYLNGNQISQISKNSFSKFDKLFYLDLSSNKIENLGKKSLRGLTSLQRLFFANNGLQNIEAGAFRDLGELRELNLEKNEMTECKKDVFFDLKELLFLNLDDNKFKRITKDTFKGLPHNLRGLELEKNEIESVDEESFTKVPKYRLELNENLISKLGKGAIKIPSLANLYLNSNKLSEFKEENFYLPNLQVLELSGNRIGNIDKGTFRNSGNLEFLKISENPILTLENGSLFGIQLHAEIQTFFGKLELIQASAFLDE